MFVSRILVFFKEKRRNNDHILRARHLVVELGELRSTLVALEGQRLEERVSGAGRLALSLLPAQHYLPILTQ